MASAQQNLSSTAIATLPSAVDMVVGVVVSDWNKEVTSRLLEGACSTLLRAGCKPQNIHVRHVPGAFELPLAAQFFAQNSDIDGVITLGCVVRGDTPHFDYVCSGVTQGVMNVQLTWNLPVTFGLLTVENQQQALDRCGGIHGNKGDEAAVTLIEMITMHRQMEVSETDEQRGEDADSDFIDIMGVKGVSRLS